MAIARLSVKVGARGKAAAHAAYIAREAAYARRGDAEAVGVGNMPTWAQSSPQAFWVAADANERSNGSAYREFEIALPRELTPEQRRELVDGFVRQELGQVHAYQWAIHNPPALDGGEQPHVHLMFSERRNDGHDRDADTYFRRYNAKAPEAGGAKKGWGERPGEKLTRQERAAELARLRDRWETACNAALDRAGVAERIDMRSLEQRGIRRKPEPKQSPKRWNSRAGRALIQDLRAARSAFDGARDKLRELMPAGPRAEIAKLLGADKKVSRGIYEKMPLDKLRALVAKKPPTMQQQIDADPRLRELRGAQMDAQNKLRELAARRQIAAGAAAAARKIETEYRLNNAWRAGLHDRGVQPVKVLADAAEKQRQAAEQLAELAPEIAAQQQAADAAKVAATERQAALIDTLTEPTAEAQRKHANAAATFQRREALDALVREISDAAREGRQARTPEAVRLLERMREAQALGSGKEMEERRTIEAALADKPEAVASLREALGIERGHDRQR